MLKAGVIPITTIPAVKIWIRTGIGNMFLIMIGSGCRQYRAGGPLIVMDVGPGSLTMAGPGSLMNRGVGPRTTMGAGFIGMDHGAGGQGRWQLLPFIVLFGHRPTSTSLGSGLVLESPLEMLVGLRLVLLILTSLG